MTGQDRTGQYERRRAAQRGPSGQDKTGQDIGPRTLLMLVSARAVGTLTSRVPELPSKDQSAQLP